MEQENDLEKAKRMLKEAARINKEKDKNVELFETFGCCTIQVGGGSAQHDNVTEDQCEFIAGRIPGAIFDFQPNVECN